MNLQWLLTNPLWEATLRQRWIIENEWSKYHEVVSTRCGWVLEQRQGLWHIVALSGSKFPDDAAAHDHVLACEADPQHPEHNLAVIATHAIMVGSING